MGKLKEYMFTLDIKGTCFITIEAESLDEAAKKIINGEGESHLNEWDTSFPYNCTVEALGKFCANNPDKLAATQPRKHQVTEDEG